MKLVGFAHKKNAKRTLENNFILDQDYKVIKLPREQNLSTTEKDKGGRPEEQIMLNIDTFTQAKPKGLCSFHLQCLSNIYSIII